jgi:hypothetical protein
MWLPIRGEPSVRHRTAASVPGSQHEDPVALRRPARDFPDARDHLVKTWHPADRWLLVADDARVFHVTMVVDESRDDHPSPGVVLTRAAGFGPHLARLADHCESTVAYEHGGCCRALLVERDDARVDQREVRARRPGTSCVGL